MQALGRRATPAAPPVLAVADLVLDQARRVVTRGGAPLDLTRKEFGVLEELLKARGGVVSSEELLERVWDANTDPFTTTVRVTMMTLRKKLGDPPLIETVVGAGYRVPDRASAHDRRRRVTVYGAARPAARLRPTLRLRLTLLNGILLVGAGAVLVAAGLAAGRRRAAPGRRAARRHPRWCSPTAATLDARAVAGAGGRRAPRRSCWSRAWSRCWPSAWSASPGRTRSPAGRCARCTRSPRPRSGSARRRSTSGSATPAPTTRWPSWPRTFDAMLDRLGRAFEAQKRFVANASHELRTPLAVMRTEIDVTLADPEADVAEYRRMATVVRDASERANGLVDALLVLARSEAQSGRRLVRKVPTDLADRRRARRCRRCAAEAERLKLDVTDRPAAGPGGRRPEPARPARRQPDRERGPLQPPARPGSGCAPASDAEHAWLVVGNTGFEVDQADVPGLFEPFRRGGRERTGARGSGLGLSIVRAVCDAHGGTVTAVAQQPDGGLEVTVCLPASV